MTIQDLEKSNIRNQRRIIKLESDLDIAEENHKTLLKDNEILRTELEALKDRVKYNHNDMTGLTENMIELEKDIEYLKGMELVEKKSIWDIFR